jgi:hypothetical protein
MPADLLSECFVADLKETWERGQGSVYFGAVCQRAKPWSHVSAVSGSTCLKQFEDKKVQGFIS